LAEVARDSDAWKLIYNTNGQLISEVGIAGALNGLRVTNAFDEFLRRTNVSSANGATILTTNGYTFDNAGRLSTARDGTFVATYGYLANSPLVSQITFKSNTTVRLTTTKQYDYLNRLGSISSQPSASGLAPIAHSYSYNDANQRTRVNLADGSFWIYEYDALGQVKSGKRYWSDWTPVAGQQFEYGFDDIGNRTSTKAGGDSSGANLRLANYTNNTLNQITSRDVPGYLNVIGAASATATNVNVNNVMAYRRGEYYRVELNPNNASAAVWQSVTNCAVQNGTTNSVTGNLFLPKTPEVFAYDADGNLTNDGRWAYLWDGENRLVRQFGPTTGPSGSVKALTYGYDWQGRRISKTVSNYSGGSWSKVLDEKYLYDAWNQLASLNASNSAVVRAFLWGSDLSGTMQGAGGVGGLLAVNAKGASVTFPAFDGNGNVMALVNAAGGDALANYEYGPFGEMVRCSGSAAKTNPFRFSTKFQDDETDLLYYGHRYRPASPGGWLSRDPIGELGGVNLYGFVGNAAIQRTDSIGLAFRIPGWVVAIIPADLLLEIYAALLDMIEGEHREKVTFVHDVLCPPGCSKELLRTTTLKEIEYATINIGWTGAGSVWDFDWRNTTLYVVHKYFGCCKSHCFLFSNTERWKKERSSRVIIEPTTVDIAGEDGWLASLNYQKIAYETKKERNCVIDCRPISEQTRME
jgi:RHS repeat-associated protein